MYGPGGDWNVLLGRSQGFIESRLQREESTESYRLVDIWWSHWDFENFRRMRQNEIDGFKSRVSGIVIRELLLGSFYLDGSGEDGAEVVPG